MEKDRRVEERGGEEDTVARRCARDAHLGIVSPHYHRCIPIS
jgi:hypothetical protein